MFITCRYSGLPILGAETFLNPAFRLTNKFDYHPIFALELNELNALAEHFLDMSDDEKHCIFTAYLLQTGLAKFETHLTRSIYSLSAPVFASLVKLANYFNTDECLISYFPEFRVYSDTMPEQLDQILHLWEKTQKKQMYLIAQKRRDNMKAHQENITRKIIAGSQGIRPLGEKLTDYAIKWLQWGADASDNQIRYVKKVLETDKKSLAKLNMSLARQARQILNENLPETNEEMRIKKMVILKHIDMLLDGMVQLIADTGDVETDLVVVVNTRVSYAIKDIVPKVEPKHEIQPPNRADYNSLGTYLRAMSEYRMKVAGL